jgi:hypothetical protein
MDLSVHARSSGPPPWLLDPTAIPALPPLRAPAIAMVLPNGAQTSLPGTLWPNPRVWELTERAQTGPPPIEIRRIKRKQSNPLIEEWGTHDLGAETRRYGYTAFALLVFGTPIALATAATSHSKSVDQKHGLRRTNVIELTRLCRSEEPLAAGCLRIMLRAWREFLATQYWTYNTVEEVVALITYSMPGKAGHIYRADGWRKLRDCKPWGGRSNWSGPSRTGSKPGALWVYQLPEHRRLPANDGNAPVPQLALAGVPR